MYSTKNIHVSKLQHFNDQEDWRFSLNIAKIVKESTPIGFYASHYTSTFVKIPIDLSFIPNMKSNEKIHNSFSRFDKFDIILAGCVLNFKPI